MFYSTELLSIRRKGKLARCWLAAFFNEKMFKKTCRPTLIKQIDVVVTCDEILSTIELRAGRNYGRFSLYLSSQLMYGVTKILFYQTKLFQDYLFEVSWKVQKEKRSREDYDGLIDLEVPDVPGINEVFRNLEESRNLHLIPEEPYTSAINLLVQDEMNFGVLPNHEMEKFMLPEAEELPLLVFQLCISTAKSNMQTSNEIRRWCWDDTIEIPGESVQVPLVDVDKLDTIENEIEVRSPHAAKEQREFIVEDSRIAKHAHTISRKRTVRSPPEETPRKRSKGNIAKQLEPVPSVEPESALVHQLEHLKPVQIPSVPDAELIHEIQQINLPPVESIELTVESRPKRKRKLFDQQTKLSDAVMRKCIQNVTVHTVVSHPYLPTLPFAGEYLSQPSTKVINRLWANKLINLFNQHLNKQLSIESELPNVLNFEIEETIVGETIRADNSNKLRDQTGEISSKIFISTTDTMDPTKTASKILETENFQVRVPGDQSKEPKEFEELVIGFPDITGFEENIGEGTKALEKIFNESRLKSTTKSASSSFSSKVHLSKRELLALMEIRWHEERLIKFHELISPENYSKFDAAYAFQCCLEFEAEKVAILKQAEPFDIIWIEKYPDYSSQSGEDTSTT